MLQLVISAWASQPNAFAPAASCFPLSQAVRILADDTPWADGVVLVVEEETICRGDQGAVGPWFFRPHGWVKPDDPDMGIMLDAVDEIDPRLGELFRADHERTKTGVRAKPYSAADIEDVVHQLVAKRAIEAPNAVPVSVVRTGDLVRVTASTDPVLDHVVTVDRDSCPVVRGFPTGTLIDEARCAFEGVEGVGIPYNPNIGGAYWTGNELANPGVWVEMPVWQILSAFYQRYGHGRHGFVVMVDDRIPPPDAPAHFQMRRVPTLNVLD